MLIIPLSIIPVSFRTICHWKLELWVFISDYLFLSHHNVTAILTPCTAGKLPFTSLWQRNKVHKLVNWTYYLDGNDITSDTGCIIRPSDNIHKRTSLWVIGSTYACIMFLRHPVHSYGTWKQFLEGNVKCSVDIRCTMYVRFLQFNNKTCEYFIRVKKNVYNYGTNKHFPGDRSLKTLTFGGTTSVNDVMKKCWQF